MVPKIIIPHAGIVGSAIAQGSVLQQIHHHLHVNAVHHQIHRHHLHQVQVHAAVLLHPQLRVSKPESQTKLTNYLM